MSSFICPLCTTNRGFVGFSTLFHHITIYHQHEPNFRITCDLQKSCGVLYRTYSAYKSHIYRQHLSELKSKDNYGKFNAIIIDNHQENRNLDIESETTNDSNSYDVNSVGSDDDFDFVYPSSLFNVDDNGENISEILTNLKKSYISFVLQLREEYLLPKTVMHIISTYIVTLIHQVQVLLKAKVFDYLSDNDSFATPFRRPNQKVVSMNEIQQTMSDVCTVIDSTTKNDYQFLKSCQKHFNYSPIEEINVSSDDEVPEYAYYIPIDKTISSMLGCSLLLPEILENIKKQRTIVKRDDDIMFSIRDASYGRTLDHDNIFIQLYMDDIGLTNPIGSKRDRHKMSMLYMLLEDLPDKYRSKLDYIQLVGVCPSGILKDKTKSKCFFDPIVDNLNNLQLNGLIINGIHLKFSFSTLVADNLAAHYIGGFQLSFNSGYFCRRCHITYENKNSSISSLNRQIRTRVSHDDLVEKIINDPNNKSLMGVVGPSPLANLLGFHATTALPADPMHDFLEGACLLVTLSLLKQASSLRLLTYNQIQERTQSFEYGYFDNSNQPPPILVKHLHIDRITATASQKLCLYKLFPIIFNDIIDHLPSYVVYQLLREILDLILSQPFRKKWLPTLRELCNAFHEAMLEHFPNRVSPKIHFISEYCEILDDFGPIVRQWCMRYESFHLYFKKLVTRTNNFKNIPKMLVTRCHLKQCLKFSLSSRLTSSQYVIGIRKTHSRCFNMSMKHVLSEHFDPINFNQDLYQCKRLVNESIEYCQSAIYVIDLKPSHEQPIFAQVIFILKINEKWWLLIDHLDTIAYSEKLCAWNIQSVGRYSIIDPNEMKYFHKGLDIYVVKNLSFVSFTSRLTLY